MYPTFLYHRTYVNGKVFTDKDQYEKAKKEGWVSTPADIGKAIAVEPEVSKKGYPAKKKKSVKSKKRVR